MRILLEEAMTGQATANNDKRRCLPSFLLVAMLQCARKSERMTAFLLSVILHRGKFHVLSRTMIVLIPPLIAALDK